MEDTQQEQSEEPQSTKIKGFDVIEAGMAKMKEALSVIPDATEKKGYELLAENIKGGKDLIKKIDAVEEKLKRPHMNDLETIRSTSKNLIKEIKEIIEPHIEAKKEVDKATEERRRIKREEKAQHVAEIKEKLNQFSEQVAFSVGKPSGLIGVTLATLKEIDVEDGSYEEFQDDAIVERMMAIEKLEKMHTVALESETKIEELRINQEKLDKERAEFEAKQVEAKEKIVAEEKAKRLKEEAEAKAKREQSAIESIDSFSDLLKYLKDCKTSEEMQKVQNNFVRSFQENDYLEFQGEATERFNHVNAQATHAIAEKIKEEVEVAEEAKRRNKLITKIEGLKEVLADVVTLTTSGQIADKLISFTDDFNEFDFQECEEEANVQFDALITTINTVRDGKITEEREQDRIAAENKRLREAEQKRIEEENEAKRVKFEAEEKERQEAEAKEKRVADIKLNAGMREEAIDALHSQVCHIDTSGDDIVRAIEEGLIPHMRVEWTPQLLKESDNIKA